MESNGRAPAGTEEARSGDAPHQEVKRNSAMRNRRRRFWATAAHSGCLKVTYPFAMVGVIGTMAIDGAPAEKSFGGATATNHPRGFFWAKVFKARLSCAFSQSVIPLSSLAKTTSRKSETSSADLLFWISFRTAEVLGLCSYGP